MPEVFNNEVLCKHVIKIPLPDYMLNLVETIVIVGVFVSSDVIFRESDQKIM